MIKIILCPSYILLKITKKQMTIQSPSIESIMMHNTHESILGIVGKHPVFLRSES